MNNFQKLKISDVCDFIGGSQPPKSEFSNFPKEGYIRLVQTRDFKTDNFITYIPKDSTSKFFDKTDIMIGRYGPPIFQIFRGMEGAYNVALLKAMPKPIIIKDYLYYFLLQKSVFEYVDKLSARTGGQTGVDLYSLYKYPINLPDIENQKKIAKVLSDLDAKIELNNKINTELEAMAKTLYDYWFVQFDFPNENGKPYKSSGGKMVWNGELKREIPEGWEVKSLSYICEIINGYAFKSEWYTDSGIKIIRTKNFENGYVDLNDLVFLDNEFAKQFDKYQLKTYDFLMVMVGASTGKHCTVNSNILPALQNQNMWRFISKIENQQLFLNLKLQRIVLELENTTNGSARGFFQKDSFLSKIVEVPNRDLIEDFCNKINSVFKRIDNNLKENQELASLRDWLLPMLMNGQVSVASPSTSSGSSSATEEQLGMVAESGVEYKEG